MHLHRFGLTLGYIAVALFLVGVDSAAVRAATSQSESSLSSQLAAVKAQLATDQKRVAALNEQMEATKSALDQRQRMLAADQRQQDSLRVQLSALARLDYKRDPTLLVQLMQAKSLSQLLLELGESRQIDANERELLIEVSRLKARDEQARTQLRRDFGKLQDAVATATSIAQRDLALQQSLQKKLAAARAAAAAAAEAARQAQLAAEMNAVAGTAGTVSAQATAVAVAATFSAVGNHFSFGYCTWYVASRLVIPWYGNAIEWWGNASAYGYAEGQVPRSGAILVEGFAPVGHVAYVESVNSDGSFVVSEMNFQGWDVVDTRTVTRADPVIGFIYGAKPT
jgi:surface antigen